MIFSGGKLRVQTPLRRTWEREPRRPKQRLPRPVRTHQSRYVHHLNLAHQFITQKHHFQAPYCRDASPKPSPWSPGSSPSRSSSPETCTEAPSWPATRSTTPAPARSAARRASRRTTSCSRVWPWRMQLPIRWWEKATPAGRRRSPTESPTEPFGTKSEVNKRVVPQNYVTNYCWF